MAVSTLDLREAALEVSTDKETIEVAPDKFWHVPVHVGGGREERGYAFRQRAMQDGVPRFAKHA